MRIDLIRLYEIRRFSHWHCHCHCTMAIKSPKSFLSNQYFVYFMIVITTTIKTVFFIHLLYPIFPIFCFFLFCLDIFVDKITSDSPTYVRAQMIKVIIKKINFQIKKSRIIYQMRHRKIIQTRLFKKNDCIIRKNLFCFHDLFYLNFIFLSHSFHYILIYLICVFYIGGDFIGA